MAQLRVQQIQKGKLNMLKLENGTMKSTEVVEQLNIFRTLEVKSQKTHHHFLRDLREEFKEEIETSKIGFIYEKLGNTKPTKVALLTTDQAKQMLMKESRVVRKAMVEYINNLEKQVEKLRVPQTFSEALRLASEQAEMLEIQAPKVEHYEAVMESESLLSWAQTANILGIGRNKLTAQLRGMGILKKDNTPYAKYTKYFEVKITHHSRTLGEVALATTRVNQRGLEFLRKTI